MTAIGHETPIAYATEQYAFAAGVALLAVIYLFAPLLSFIAGLLFLTVFTARLYRVARIGAAVVTIFAGSSVWASRTFGANMSDDFQQYYDIYYQIDHQHFTTGVIPAYEFVLPAFFKLVSLVLPSLTPNGLMFVCAVTAGLILLAYLEHFGLEDFTPEKKGYGVAIAFLFFSFVMVTQLTRQMMSSVLLVYLFFAAPPLWRRASLGLAALLHLTAVGVHATIRLLQRRYLTLAILILSGILFIKFGDVDALAGLVIQYNIPRIGYYLTAADSGGNVATFAVVLVVFLTGTISLTILKLAGQPLHAREKNAMVVVGGAVVVYLLTLSITLLPFRLFLVIHAVLAGWFLALFTRRFPVPYLLIGGVALILYRTRSLYIIDPASAFVPWGIYGMFGGLPGYYFLSYFAA